MHWMYDLTWKIYSVIFIYEIGRALKIFLYDVIPYLYDRSY